MLANLFTRFGWSRDDFKWTAGMILSIIVGLATLTDKLVVSMGLPLFVIPALPYCRLVALVVGFTSAKMATSNLFGAGNVPSPSSAPVNLNKVGVLLVAALVGAGALTLGCGGKRHAAVVADVALYETLNDVHAAEQLALCGLPSCAQSIVVEYEKGWTKAKSEAFNTTLLPAVRGGRGFNAILKAWVPGTPLPKAVTDIVQSLAQSLTNVTEAFPEGATKTKVLAAIAKSQTLVLSALSLVLSFK